MQAFLEKQKQMLKEDLASLEEIKSRLIKSNEQVNNELRILYATMPPLGSRASKVDELSRLRIKLTNQLAIIRKQIADIESAINN
ncbi:hypothetical protein, partial [Bacillus thuringiensis]|uniref:hypothetical protein n=1 Tax=Bacillus thuringiensis TaxID=1428 RepID=UPI003F5295A2